MCGRASGSLRWGWASIGLFFSQISAADTFVMVEPELSYESGVLKQSWGADRDLSGYSAGVRLRGDWRVAHAGVRLLGMRHSDNSGGGLGHRQLAVGIEGGLSSWPHPKIELAAVFGLDTGVWGRAESPNRPPQIDDSPIESELIDTQDWRRVSTGLRATADMSSALDFGVGVSGFVDSYSLPTDARGQRQQHMVGWAVSLVFDWYLATF